MTDKNASQGPKTDLLRLVTAGGQADGKTELINRLFYETKTTREEQQAAVARDEALLSEQPGAGDMLAKLRAGDKAAGSTEATYSYLTTPRRRIVIADPGGGEEAVAEFVAAAKGANVALLLIDAKAGIRLQTRRHAFLASLLGIPHIVVCVNKMDEVQYAQERFDSLCEEFTEFAARLDINDLDFIPVCASKGSNVAQRSPDMPWYEGVLLLRHLERVHVASDRNLIDFRFPIQEAPAAAEGHKGCIVSGRVSVGEKVRLLPAGKDTVVKKILGEEGELQMAYAPQQVQLLLEDPIEASTGNMLVHPGNLPNVEHETEAMLIWTGETPLAVGAPLAVEHTTSTVQGRVTELTYQIDPETLHRQDADSLARGDVGRVNLQFFQPIICDEYIRNLTTGRLLIKDPKSGAVLATGVVIERAKHRTGVHTEAEASPVSQNITRHVGNVTSDDRQNLYKQTPVTLWLTGLSGSGKSTVGYALEKHLIEQGQACYVLDGDNIRHRLNRDLGFTPEDRTENIRRIAEVARLMNDAGMIVITAFISPYRKVREDARSIIGEEQFVEVYVDASLEVCESRDPKGLYKKARAGEIPGFTGISAPYEAPESPDFSVHTGEQSLEECVASLDGYLRERGVVQGVGIS